MKPSPLMKASERARLVELRARKVVSEQLNGASRSVFRGRGIDFDEVREYVAGDDVRSIDWNVTARANKPFVKRFREERELTVMLLVDLSASGEFSSQPRSKREFMAELACVVALAALRQRDKVGLLLFSDRVELFVPPAAGRSHVSRLVNEILLLEPKGLGTDLPGALDYLNQRVGRRAAVILISDLILASGTSEQAFAERLSITGRRHELFALWVQDPCELSMPDVGRLTLEDAETGEVVVLDTGRRRVREQFARLTEQARDARRRQLHGAGARVLELQTAGDYLPRLAGFLSGRPVASAGVS